MVLPWTGVRWSSMQVSWEDFQAFAQLRQSIHRLAVALDFFFSTEGKVGKEDFAHAVAKILGRGLPTLLVSALHAAGGMQRGADGEA